MATLIQSYEQQYSILTADITAKIGRLKSGTEGSNLFNKNVILIACVCIEQILIN